MAAGKWIEGLTADTPLADAARLVLDVRLQVVGGNLDLAVREPEQDSEHVHQLRVGTRRAGAAVRLFADCLPDKARRAVKHWLRGLRRAAGAARDWDVFLIELGEQARAADGQPRPGPDLLAGYALANRLAAQQTLADAAGDPADFEALIAKTVKAVRKPRGPARVLLDLARPTLVTLLGTLTDAVGGDLQDYAHLHQCRIHAKRLRYAMEIFAGCFEDDFRTAHYAAVEGMQDILGRANDSHVALERLTKLRDAGGPLLGDDWPRYRDDIGRLIRYHEERLPRERQNFEDCWRAWQSSGGRAAFLHRLDRAGVG